MKFKKQTIFLILIFLLAFGLRLYKVDNPIADWHSWRQADTASISRNFIKEGFTPLFPKSDSLYALNSYGEKNVNRYFFAEFPLYNIISYPFYYFFGVNEAYLRAISAFFSSLTTVMLFFLAKRYSSTRVAYLSAIFLAIIPFNIYYGRVTMPDPLYVFLSVTALLLVSLWLEKKTVTSSIWAGLMLALAILTKPYALVLGLPVLLLIIATWPKSAIKKYWWQVLLVLVLAITPYLAWRYHINQYPEGQFGTEWLFNSTNIRFTGAFFHWILFERFNKLILGGGGFVLFFVGLVCPKKKSEWLFYLSWLAALGIFIVVIATGNVTHDYYQLPLLPIMAILAAKGAEAIYLLGQKQLVRRIFNGTIILSLVLMMLAFGWFEVRGFYQINNPAIVEAGEAVDQLTPSDALVIAPYNWDPAFLYQTNRWGWPQLTDSIENMIAKGATHYVSTALDEKTQEIMADYNIIKQTDSFVLVELVSE